MKGVDLSFVTLRGTRGEPLLNRQLTGRRKPDAWCCLFSSVQFIFTGVQPPPGDVRSSHQVPRNVEVKANMWAFRASVLLKS